MVTIVIMLMVAVATAGTDLVRRLNINLTSIPCYLAAFGLLLGAGVAARAQLGERLDG